MALKGAYTGAVTILLEKIAIPSRWPGSYSTHVDQMTVIKRITTGISMWVVTGVTGGISQEVTTLHGTVN